MRTPNLIYGSLLAAVIWETTKNILVWYIAVRMPHYQLIYGSLVVIVVSILWSYFFSVILVAVACLLYQLENFQEQRGEL